MNKLNLYVIRDEVSQDNSFIVSAINDEEAKRNVKLALCSNEQNFINMHTKDKRLVLVGSLDVSTGVITPEQSPIPLFTIEEIRLELVHEIAVAKSKVLAEYLAVGIKKEDVERAKDLVTSLFIDFDLDKAVIEQFKHSKEFNEIIQFKINQVLALKEKVEGVSDGNKA